MLRSLAVAALALAHCAPRRLPVYSEVSGSFVRSRPCDGIPARDRAWRLVGCLGGYP
jgi:hypothetical protein